MNNETVTASATVLINTLAQEKIALGIQVFNLSAGEPKLPPHEAIIQATTDFIQQGEIFYPHTAGSLPLRNLATKWVNENYACNYTHEECLIIPGGKFGLYLLLQHLLHNSNLPYEVLIPSPYWVSYPAISQMFGGIVKFLVTQELEGWKVTPKLLKDNCTNQTKVLILNNPVNPTGALYSREELAALLKIAKENNLLVIADEVYSKLIYTDYPYASCGSFLEYKDQVVVIQSMSKNFAMTGWRVGFMWAPLSLIKPLTALISQTTSGVSIVNQQAALAALKHANEITSLLRNNMLRQRNLFIQTFKQHFGVQLIAPKSTVYLLVALAQLGIHHINDNEFCVQALEQANVALVPGSAFGANGYVRFSFAAAEEDLIGGIASLSAWCKQLMRKF